MMWTKEAPTNSKHLGALGQQTRPRACQKRGLAKKNGPKELPASLVEPAGINVNQKESEGG